MSTTSLIQNLLELDKNTGDQLDQNWVLLLKEYNRKKKDILFSPKKRYSVDLKHHTGEFDFTELQQIKKEKEQNYPYLISKDFNSVRIEHDPDIDCLEQNLTNVTGKMALYNIELMDENNCKAYVGKLMIGIEKEIVDQTSIQRLSSGQVKSKSPQFSELKDGKFEKSSEDVMDSCVNVLVKQTNNSLREKGKKRKQKIKYTEKKAMSENILYSMNETQDEVHKVIKEKSTRVEDRYIPTEDVTSSKLSSKLAKSGKNSCDSSVTEVNAKLEKTQCSLNEKKDELMKAVIERVNYLEEELMKRKLRQQTTEVEEMSESVRKYQIPQFLQDKMTKEHMVMPEDVEQNDEIRGEMPDWLTEIQKAKKELDEIPEVIEKLASFVQSDILTEVILSEQTEFLENINYNIIMLLLVLCDCKNVFAKIILGSTKQCQTLHSKLSSNADKHQLTSDKTCLDKTARKDKLKDPSTSINDIERIPHVCASLRNAEIDLQRPEYRIRDLKLRTGTAVCRRMVLKQGLRIIGQEDFEDALSEAINQSVRKGALRDASIVPPHVIDPTSCVLDISKSVLCKSEASTAQRQNVHPVSGNETQSTFFTRFSSFSTWPLDAPYSALRLIDAGFCYEHSSSTIKCHFCGIQVDCKNQIQEFRRQNMTALQMHKELNSDCVHVKNVEQPRRQDNDVRDSSLTSIASNINNLIISSEDEPGAKCDNNCIDQIIDNTIQSDFNLPFDIKNSEQKNTLTLTNGIQNDNTSIQMPLHNRSADLTSKGAMMSQQSLSSSHNVMNELIHQKNNQSISQNDSETNYVSLINEENETYEVKYPHFKSVISRLETYRSWQIPEIQDPKNLTEAGFYFTGNRDIVRCFCCDIGLAEWEDDDDPWVEHARHSPDCRYLREKKGDGYINYVQTEWKKIYNPKHPEYNEIQARLDSFVDWPEELHQTPDVLAAAGFFYIGQNDEVKCHYCDGGFKEWGPDEEPWTEHAHWFPFCKYLLKVRGMEFIEEVEKRNASELFSTVVARSVNSSEHTTNHQRRIDDAENSDPFSNPAAETLMSMGYTRNQIQYVINSFIRQNGQRRFGAEDLLHIIMDMEERNEEFPFQSNVNNGGCSNSQTRHDLETENRWLKSRMLCIKCKKKDRNIVFIPCGHRLLCEQCSSNVTCCPTCQKQVKNNIKVFLA